MGKYLCAASARCFPSPARQSTISQKVVWGGTRWLQERVEDSGVVLEECRVGVWMEAGWFYRAWHA